jgi:hypothetical protein
MSFSRWNPPPPTVSTSSSEQISHAEISQIIGANPSNPYLEGLPILYRTIPFDPSIIAINNRTVKINFNETPFTYLNISDITNSSSESIFVELKNVPIGTIFIVNGPSSFEGAAVCQLILKDLDSDGNPLLNDILDIQAKGTIEEPTEYVNIIVCRIDTGLVGRAMQ